MLVLTRKEGEQIRIGTDTVISVLKIEGGTIRIGIDAPRHVPILRMEVFEKILQENVAAASPDMEEIANVMTLITRKIEQGA